MRAQNSKKRQFPHWLSPVAALAAGVVVYGTLAISPDRADALIASDVVILYPRASAQVLKGTNVSVEVVVNAAGTFTADLDVTTNAVQTGSSLSQTDEKITSAFSTNTPVRFDPHAIAATGGGNINVLIKDGTTGTPLVIQSSTVTLADSLQFKGAMWIGATTPICKGGSNAGVQCTTDADCLGGGICGGDAPGWISAANANNYTNQCGISSSTYTFNAVKQDDNATIQSDAWAGETDCTATNNAGSLGWLTFKPVTGKSPPPSSDPETWSDTSYNRFYTAVTTVGSATRYPSQIAGWGKFLVYGPDDGWVHLRGKEMSAPYSDQATGGFAQCLDCSSAVGVSISRCNICQQVKNSGVASNASCNSCGSCTNSGGLVSCDSCDVCNTYGVSFDQSQNQNRLVGYAWAGVEKDGGLGWIQFDQISANAIIAAWLQTQYGDIFSNKDVILSTPSASQYNATYLIQAGGTIGVDTRSGGQQPLYPPIGLPSSTTQYINVLGRLNFDEMLKRPTNRYGMTVDLSSQGSTLGTYINNSLLGKLDGKIYYILGDATIDIPMTIENGVSGSGAGTIIVDGDLTINGDVLYDSLSGTSLVNIPSVAWIVRGNITIDPNVTQLVGVFFALGCPGDADGDGSYDLPCGGAQPGLFDAGSSSNQLVMSGLVMAYQFDVSNRTYVNQLTKDPAVQVNYDGRFIANPPPGLQNLAALLPTVRQSTP